VFTGIVQDLVCVLSVEHESDISRLAIDLGEHTDKLQLGASVAVNGTCLTVTRVQQGTVCFDVIVETLRTTNLGVIQAGDYVNIERSFRVGDEVGGHILSGHVTATAELMAKNVAGHDHILCFKLDQNWLKYVFHKGFIALDGASLTVSNLDRQNNTFTVSLIPETLARTTLGQLKVGDSVNVEVDSQTLATVETLERIVQDPAWREQFATAHAS